MDSHFDRTPPPPPPSTPPTPPPPQTPPPTPPPPPPPPPPTHVIVGSGFGGSVTAYRLAEAEPSASSSAGAPTRPARSPAARIAPARASGTRPGGLMGMYHYWSFKGIDALVSAELGGGSLIYANVFIRKDENWFVQEDLRDGGYEYWPVTRADLDPHYDRVEAMIGLQRYPFDHEPYAIDAEDDRLQGGRRGQRPRVVPAQAGGHLRQHGPPARARRGDRGGAHQPPRPHPHDLPAVRRVRRGLQLRRQEHARLQLPDARPAPRRAEIRTLRRRAPLRARATAAATRVHYADAGRRHPAETTGARRCTT